MIPFQDLLNKIAGSEQEFDMPQRIFNCAIMASIATFLPAAIFIFFLGADTWIASIGLLIYTVLYGYIYWLGRYKNKLQRAVNLFAFVGASILNIGWLVDRGPAGSAADFLFIVIIIIVFTSNKPIRMVIAVTVNIIIISLVDDYLRQWINWSVPASDSGQVASLLCAMFYLFILTIMYRGLIGNQINSAVGDVMHQVAQESNTVNSTADTLAGTGDDLLKSTLQQITAIEELSAATEQLNASAQQNTHQAEDAMTGVKNTEVHLDISRDNVEKLAQAIENIRQSSAEIQSINNVINDISYQTNLLSLNAMIEASRGGEENGGFKVVALEVKKLAERSAEAAEKINHLLSSNIDSVKEGVNLSNTMRTGFDEIIELMQPLAVNIQNVSEASYEQSVSIRQITEGLNNINGSVDENKLLAESSSETALELRKNAAALSDVVYVLSQSLEEHKD